MSDYDYRWGHTLSGTPISPPKMSEAIVWENNKARDIRTYDECYVLEEYKEVTRSWAVVSKHYDSGSAIQAAKEESISCTANGEIVPALRVVFYREQSET